MEKRTDVLIVGGSAAGVTAGITVRRYYPQVKITLIRKEKKVLIPCGIPYIFGTLDSPEKDLIPDVVLSNNNIDLIIDEVTLINKGNKTVTTANDETIKYERLILATGSSPLIPPLPGVELDNVFAIRKDIEYLKKILNVLEKSRDIVIIGGGFIGLEFADEYKKRGLNVTVVELLPHCLILVCDEEMCIRVEKKLSERGIKILSGKRAKAILGEGKVEYVEIEDGQRLKADMVTFGIGVVPNVKLAEASGLRSDKREGIWVDDFMRTNDENIFACGDCAQKKYYLSGVPTSIRLASVATTEARIAGANLFGIRRRMDYSIGIFSTCFGDLAIGSAGMTERNARKLGIDVVTSEVTAPDKHPGCISGTQELGVKLIFKNDTGLLIGGQVYGGKSVGELTNFIGSMIQHKMRADEVCTFQMGTHPMLTASPVAYQIANAAQIATIKMAKGKVR